MKNRISTPNELVWCTTPLAKLSFNHSISRTHSWCSSFFNKNEFKRLLHILRIVMLSLFSETSGGGLHWRGTRAAAPAAVSRSPSHCQCPRVPPHQSTGQGSNTRSLGRPRPPMVENRWHTHSPRNEPQNRYHSFAKNKYKYKTVWPGPFMCGRSVPAEPITTKPLIPSHVDKTHISFV